MRAEGLVDSVCLSFLIFFCVVGHLFPRKKKKKTPLTTKNLFYDRYVWCLNLGWIVLGVPVIRMVSEPVF